MSTTLLVLGCVRIFQPVHGYEVRRELMAWHAHEWRAPGVRAGVGRALRRESA